MGLALPAPFVKTDQGLDADGVQRNFEALSLNVAVSFPAGGVIPFAGASAPVGYLLCDGSSVSTTTYARLFAVVAYTYGGSGASFNLPDLRGRAVAGKDDMGGTAASRLTSAVSGVTGTTLGNAGGGQNVHLHNHTQDSHNHTQNSHNHTQNSHNHTQDSHNHTQNQHQHTGSVSATVPYAYANGTASTVTTGGAATRVNTVSYSTPTGSFTTANVTATNVAQTATNQAQTATNQAQTATNIAATATNQSFGTGTSQNVQPTMILNYIIKT